MRRTVLQFLRFGADQDIEEAFVTVLIERRRLLLVLAACIGVAVLLMLMGLDEGQEPSSSRLAQHEDLALQAFNGLKPGMTPDEVSSILWPANMVKQVDGYQKWIYILPDGRDYAFVTLYFDMSTNTLVNAVIEQSNYSNTMTQRNKVLESLPYS